jgi:nitrate/TMAO reductase-like tetraheme cytochrome c subunit
VCAELKRASLIVLLVWIAYACGADDSVSPALTHEQLLNPESCKDCHPKHYEEWSSSMHAYASKDPVFLAMNKRGQEEAQLGDFCVQCHAPMAVREKKIKDFSDLSDVPERLQGVTCYFCHNAVNVKGHNNAQIELAKDTSMRAALTNPKPLKPPAHDVPIEPSKFHDRSSPDSAELCGSCHDIENPLGYALENTFSEYQKSIQATAKPGNGFLTCQSCHMKGKRKMEPAAPGFDGGPPSRETHWHHFPAVDVALTPDFPHQDILRESIEKCELQTATVSVFDIDIAPNRQAAEPFAFEVIIEHNVGHNLPSGASADRRLWVQVAVYDEQDQVVFESGRIADGELEEKPKDDPKYDPQFVPFRDYLLDEDGNETHMFWKAATLLRTDLIPYATTTVPGSHTSTRTFVMTKRTMSHPPPRIEFWLRLRPVGVDVMQDLVQSGHLDPAVIDAMPTYTLSHKVATLNSDMRSYRAEPTEEFFDGLGCEKFVTMFDAVSSRQN